MVFASPRISCIYYFFKSLAISANCERAASKSSTISAAIMSGSGEIGAVFEAFVFEPEDVKVEFVALGSFFVGEAFEALGLFSLVAVLWIVAGDEVVEIAALQWIFFKSEMLVCS